jgi:hypothetical protein
MKVYYDRRQWEYVDSGIYYIFLSSAFLGQTDPFQVEQDKLKGVPMKITYAGETFVTYFYVKNDDPLHVYMDK